jgi:hypothetical protein
MPNRFIYYVILMLFFPVFSFAQQEKQQDSINKILEKQIQEVEITAKKKLIERKIDRLVFNVENSISASGGDALDALKVTPGIKVQNDQISMIGKSGMSVMIDDRMIQLSGDDLLNYLKTIPSDNIKSIEVITTPPAKYDAEGNSGIVNIVLKKAKKDTFSGNLKTSYTQAKYALGSFGGGLNYQKNKLTVTSNINYENGSISPYQEYTLYYPNYKWFEENNTKNFRNNLSGRIALDYKLNDKTTIGIEYSGSSGKFIRKGNNTSYITNSFTHQLDSLIITPSRIETERKIHSINFHSVTKLDSLGKQFSIDADYFTFTSDLNNNFSSNTFLPDGSNILNRYVSANSLSNLNFNIFSTKLNFDLPLKWINLSFGGKISFIDNKSSISYYNTASQIPIFDSSKSNVFNYKENTQALYVSGNKKLSEKWETQLGLRLENTQTEGFSQTLNQTNKNDYLKLFPTFYLTYNPNENNTFGLNYSRRIDRPSYGNLNPFRFYSSSFNYSEGNPFLQPFYTDNTEISYSYKNYYTSLYMSYTTNGIDEVTLVSNDNTVQKIFPYNFYKKLDFGAVQSYTFNKWSWLESNNSLVFFYSKTTSDLENALLPNIKKWTVQFNSNNSFVLNKAKTLKAELNFMYLSPSVAGSYELSSFYYFDAGFKVLFFRNKLQAAVNFMDIFRTNKSTFTQYVNSIKLESYDYSDTQKVRLSLTWNFGKQLKTEKREQSNEEERARAK